MRHFTDREVAAARAAHPGCWLVEAVNDQEAALVAIPATDENRARVLRSIPRVNITPDLLDGATHHCAGVLTL